MMRNRQQCQIRNPQQQRLYFPGCPFVQGRGPFIQYQKAGIANQRAGYGPPLPLSAGQAFAPLAHLVFQSPFQSIHEFTHTAERYRALQLLRLKILIQTDIVPDCIVKQKNLLLDAGNNLAQLFVINIVKFFPVIQDFTLIIPVITDNQMNERTFAASALPCERIFFSPALFSG